MEQTIYEYTPEKDKNKLLVEEKNPNFKRDISYYFISKEDQCDFNDISFDKYESLEQISGRKKEYDSFYLLVFIRNKLAHNQLPAKQIYQKALTFLPNSCSMLATYYLHLFSHLMDKNNKQKV